MAAAAAALAAAATGKGTEEAYAKAARAGKAARSAAAADRCLVDIPTARLRNIGNSCYMNATMQLLAAIPGFKNKFDELVMIYLEQPTPYDASDVALRETAGNFFLRFDDFLKSLWVRRHSHDPEVSTAPALLRACLHAPFDGSNQEDAEDFLLYILDRIESDSGHARWLAWHSLFLGETASKSTCSNCKSADETVHEHFLNLKLAVPSTPGAARVGIISLCSLIHDNYLTPAMLTGQNQGHCSKCRGKFDAQRVTNFTQLPPILLCSLSRFDQLGNKVLTPVSIEQVAIVAGVTYDLFGIIVHSGLTKREGHYFSYIIGSTIGQQPQWFCANDADVSAVSTEHIRKSCLGGILGETPYLVVFCRR